MQDASVQESAMCSGSAASALLCTSVGWGARCQTGSHLATLSLICLHHKDVQGMRLIVGENGKVKAENREHVCVSLCAFVTERERERDKSNRMK